MAFFNEALAFSDVVGYLLRASGCCSRRSTLTSTNASMTWSSGFLRSFFSEGFSSTESHDDYSIEKNKVPSIACRMRARRELENDE